jgi:hypothetical protein
LELKAESSKFKFIRRLRRLHRFLSSKLKAPQLNPAFRQVRYAKFNGASKAQSYPHPPAEYSDFIKFDVKSRDCGASPERLPSSLKLRRTCAMAGVGLRRFPQIKIGVVAARYRILFHVKGSSG